MPPKFSNSSGKPDKGKAPARNPNDILSSAQFKCSVGKEYKPASSFSKREWNVFEHKVKRGMKVSIHNTGMTCREHKGEPSLEYRCQGPCDKVKPISEFSKNGRTNGVYLSQENEANVEVAKEDAAAPDTHGSNQSVAFSRTQSHAASVLGSIDTDAESSIGGVHLDQRSQVSLGLPPHLILSSKEGSVVTSSYAPSETDNGSIAPGDSSSQIGRGFMPPHIARAGGRQSSIVSGSSRRVDDWDFSGRQARQPQAIEEDPFEEDDDDQESIASRSTMLLSSRASNASDVNVNEFLVDAPAPRVSRKETAAPRTTSSKWAKPRRKVEPAPLPTLEDFERPPQYDDDDSETELP
ncbi:hypothetical protein SAPIO_CDS1046 [Scedosporium apiospermum]|uniref:Stc1 domain-containing protein n=1 Tax=Pseudallescheria apiosperma TaxID=563466 RepID=A0A084GFQ9_PSEDA|nr:uncharacterized protein SAPIO_CDS1046 [Scedosporium apiospermum]KEZ46171.1 hypothetical protein SAPIO_CDS1046 [Scedosporium apiospermum]